VQVAQREVDFKKLDAVIRENIPAGFKVRREPHPLNGEIDLSALRIAKNVKLQRARLSIGTLGGGNHFIEVDRAPDGTLFVVVHSGSRHIGNEVAQHYQNMAVKQLNWSPKRKTVPKDLTYVSGDLFDDYIHDMKLIQRFADLNRQAMMEVVLRKMGLTKVDAFTTVHNYIDTESMILRKGATSAQKGERLLVPINMRDGSLICVGKGNPDWNCSAPHGAGRIMSRKAAFGQLNLEDYRKTMQGVFSTCITKDTLDEAPMAYKSMDSILQHITPTAEVLLHVKPLYNFKAGE